MTFVRRPPTTLQPEPLMTPGEVAKLFRVDPKTVLRWAKAGKIGCIKTPTGRRLYKEREVRAMFNGEDDHWVQREHRQQ